MWFFHWVRAFAEIRYEDAYWEATAENQRWYGLLEALAEEKAHGR